MCGAESYQFVCIVKWVVMYSIVCSVSVNECISILRVTTSLPCCFLSAGKVEAVSPEAHLVKTTPSFKRNHKRGLMIRFSYRVTYGFKGYYTKSTLMETRLELLATM